MKVLLLDDEIDILSSLKTALENRVYDIITESSAVNAIELIKKDKDIKVLITDIRMPEMNGNEVIKEVIKIAPQIKIIILSAYKDIETAMQVINNHAYTFFEKPVDVKCLLYALEQIKKDLRDSK